MGYFSMRILFTGGGTGGHLFPLIAVARELKKIYDPSEIYFLGSGDFATSFLEQEGIKVRIISAGKFRRYFSVQNFIDPFKSVLGIIQSFWYLYIWMPDVIFSKGGYGSVPVVLVGWLFHVPILVHESDTIPGLANRLGAKFAKRVAISFLSADKYLPVKKTALVGNPIRLDLMQACLSNDQKSLEEAKKTFGIVSQKQVIFVLGGSQGAQKINELVLSVLPRLLEKYEVIHQTGVENLEQIKAGLGSPLPDGYHVHDFLDEYQMAAAYLLANLIISRAGAGSISEIAACAKPSILIPLMDSAADHQRENAFAYAQAGATSVLEQANLTPNLFLSEINQILASQEIIQKMSANAKNFAKPEAAQRIAEALIEMGEQ